MFSWVKHIIKHVVYTLNTCSLLSMFSLINMKNSCLSPTFKENTTSSVMTRGVSHSLCIANEIPCFLLFTVVFYFLVIQKLYTEIQSWFLKKHINILIYFYYQFFCALFFWFCLIFPEPTSLKNVLILLNTVCVYF